MTSPSLKRPLELASPDSSKPTAYWPVFNCAKRKCPTPKLSDKEDKKKSEPINEIYITPKAKPSVSKSPRIETPRKQSPDQNVTPITKASEASANEGGHHLHNSYKFLYPPERLDINKRGPDHPDYDEKTLFVPSNFLNNQTPALRQWWLIKQKHMDAILFFKMGKFYELFNEDAVIGVNNLDIMFMKGDATKPAHAGFPEVSYEKYSRILLNRGYKVLRIEQTETPAMMEERCIETGQKGKFDKVVKREVCRVTTKGTQMLGTMETLFHSAKNQYLMAIFESANESETGEIEANSTIYGVCFIDVTISKLSIGQFRDDHNLSNLNILLAHYPPTEVLYERGNLSQQALLALMRTGTVMTVLKPNKEFWPIKKALSYLKTHNIFTDESGNFEWPTFLKDLFEGGDSSESILVLEPDDDYKYGLSCFAAIVYYLQSQLIADQVLKCASFEFYCTPLQTSQLNSSNIKDGKALSYPPMILDHIALRNLEIFENSSGTSELTLFDSMNHCKTHFGQRLLRNWLCSPLCDIKQIENRLDAVQALVSNDNASLMNEISHVLGQTPDLERLLSKVKSQCFKSESDSRAIMFDGDQYSKAKITSFLNILQNFKRLRKFISSVSKSVQSCDSQVLRRLLTFTTEGGLYPDYSATLEYFETAFDHETAKRTGKIIPAPGIDKTYDKCQANIDNLKEKLDNYLEEQKGVLKTRHIEYFGTAKNRYQIQIPEAYCNNVPDDYQIETTRKGFKRYYTSKVIKLFNQMTTYEEEMKRTLDGIMSTIFEQFSRKIKLWSSAIECIGILDVLQSIASFVRSLKANDIDICRPRFDTNSIIPLIEYKDGRHPALVKADPNYTPNDLVLDDKLILLSGANMGGKSTLMRQTALMVVLAQIGCFVPAASMKLTPVDRIFSRLGASDRLLEGESTFYTELVETSSMLRCATQNSLILLDELGRGTSTYDGTAIAYSVLREISGTIKCRCLFSTHYHTLVRDFLNDKNIKLAHMACKVENESTDGIDTDPLKENITFLFKISEGPVGRSYGFNVAKLAGVQNDIIKDAFERAKEMELSCKILETLQQLSLDKKTSCDRKELKNLVLSNIQ